MKLIFIYGPPAVGKLTVAEKLSEITGISLFHNHITRDLVKDLYGDELEENYNLVGKLRSTVLEYCSQNDTDIIFTYVYGGSFDEEAVKIYESNITDNGGEVCYVELTANPEDLMIRVDDKSRARFKKLTDKDVMSEIVKNLSQFSMPFVKPLKINTSEVRPVEAAKLIAAEFQLL